MCDDGLGVGVVRRKGGEIASVWLLCVCLCVFAYTVCVCLHILACFWCVCVLVLVVCAVCRKKMERWKPKASCERANGEGQQAKITAHHNQKLLVLLFFVYTMRGIYQIG